MKVMAFVCVALAAFIATSSATQYIFKADYVMRDAVHFPNSHVNGTVYYVYDDATTLKSRVRYETSYKFGDETITSTELYHYENGAIYYICDDCSAILFAASPDMWWGQATDSCDRQEGTGGNSEYWYDCHRGSSSQYSVIELQVTGKSGRQGSKQLYKPTDGGFNIRYVKFQDGRELQLSNYKVIQYDTSKFDLPKDLNCPEPECKSFADIVFVLDTSTSVDDGEWIKTKQFLKQVVSKFSYEEGGAMVGVVEFNAPEKTCCPGSRKGWWDCCCGGDNHLKTQSVRKLNCDSFWGCNVTRYIDDCLFDAKCDNKTDNTANILFELTNDRVVDKVNKLEHTYGHTCQRYGLQLAYKMLFEDENPRCKDGVCPVPIVIVVTDGEDLCHTSTEQWAKKIRDADDRGYLLEVGVGLEAQFDIDYISSLSSLIGDKRATLSVDNFDEINKALDVIIKPVCDIGNLGATCGSDCKGFCACGQCRCPVCDSGSDYCHVFECSKDYPRNGCYPDEVKCNDQTIEATKCYDQKCDPNESDPNQRCKATKLDCTAILKAQGETFANCQYVDCVNNTNGCDKSNIINDHEFCQRKAQKCYVGKCDPNGDHPDSDGCVFDKLDCSYMSDYCTGKVECNPFNGECKGEDCDPVCTRNGESFCPDRPCMVTHCNNSDALEDTIEARCTYTPFECKQQSTNNCREYVCKNNGKENTCVEVASDEKLKCSEKSTACVSYSCVDSANHGMGGCVGVNTTKFTDNCTIWTCDAEKGWTPAPKCTTELACKDPRCNIVTGVCSLADITCSAKALNITSPCFQAICKEPKGCQKKLYDGAYVDICGECVRPDGLGSEEVTESQETGCIDAPEEPLDTEGLAAAAVALIVIGAIIIGAAVAASTVLGTKALLDRARGAANQSVVSNPLFEDSQTEMSNPAFAGDTV